MVTTLRYSPRRMRFLLRFSVALLAVASVDIVEADIDSKSAVSRQSRAQWTSDRSTSHWIASSDRRPRKGIQQRGGDQSSHQQQTLTSKAWWNGCKNGLASALSAACAKTVLQPLDAIKTMQQVSQATAGASSQLTLVGACRELLQRPGGVSNFYAGLGVAAIGSMPGVGIYFGVYSYCKQHFLRAPPPDSHRQPMNPTLAVALSAAIGNTVASVSRVPYEVVKQQLQTGHYETTWQALSSIFQSPDWYRQIFPRGGIASQMLRDVPYAVVTLVCYEHFQARFGSSSRKVAASASTAPSRGSLPSRRQPATVGKRTIRQNKAWDFLKGGIAGGIGSWVTNPLDVIKTRLQTDPAGAASLYQGSLTKCFQLTLQEGGLSAFMRGSVPRLAHKIPANAFFFFFYEGFRRLLRVQDDIPAVTVASSGRETKDEDATRSRVGDGRKKR